MSLRSEARNGGIDTHLVEIPDFRVEKPSRPALDYVVLSISYEYAVTNPRENRKVCFNAEFLRARDAPDFNFHERCIGCVGRTRNEKLLALAHTLFARRRCVLTNPSFA